MNILDIIGKKRDNLELNKEEIKHLKIIQMEILLIIRRPWY